MLGRNGLSLSVGSSSIRDFAITRDDQLAGTRREHPPIHLSLDGGVNMVELKTRLPPVE